MQLFVLILNRVDCLEKLLTKMLEAGLSGATILDSKGMMHTLESRDDLPMFGTLRHVLSPDRQSSKTMLILIDTKMIPLLKKIINDVTGGLDKPDTGICFAMPVDFVEGLQK